MMLVTFLAAPLALLPAEFCSASPEPAAFEPPEWHWRTVDGRKCWFRANKLLPKEDLVWSYEPGELDQGGVVTGRRHYTGKELEAIQTIKRKMRKDDEDRPRRKQRRQYRRDDEG
jgi:hypothetical protein